MKQGIAGVWTQTQDTEEAGGLKNKGEQREHLLKKRSEPTEPKHKRSSSNQERDGT